MKKSEKTRTVFYVQRDGKDVKAFTNRSDAVHFVKHELFNSHIFSFHSAQAGNGDYCVIEAIITGNSSYPEMLNRKYEEGDTVEDKPQATSSQIKRRYLVQYQTPEMKAGWLSVDYSTPLSINAYNHAKNLVKAGIAKATRIKQVGIYS